MLNIRSAVPEDTAPILQLIIELAEYEKLAGDVVATEAQLRENLFGARPQAEVLIAEWRGETAGFALFFHNFSTFVGRRGLYLEDLFVRPAFRGKRIGKALLQQLARVAVERDCGRFEWAEEPRWPSNVNRVARPQACSARRVVQGIVRSTAKPRNAADALVVRNPSGPDLLSPTLRCSRFPGTHPAASLTPRFGENRRTAATTFEGHRGSLDWNEPARNFYVPLGAKPVPEWDIFRITGEALTRLAEHE